MKLKKIFLVASIGIAGFSATNLYAADTATTQLSSAESYKFKNAIIDNLDSLFPFQMQITIGKVTQNNEGNIVASDVLLLSGDKKNPNISINKIETKGLISGENAANDFTIKLEGISISNLATAVAGTNVVSAAVDTNGLAKNNGFYSVLMNNLGESIANLTLNYNSEDKTLAMDFETTYAKQNLEKGKVELSGIDLSNTVVDRDFLATILGMIPEATLKNAEFDADFTKLLKDVTTDYLGKKFKKTPALKMHASMGEVKGELKLDLAGELGSGNHVNYTAVIDGIDYADSKLKDILENKNKVLDDAYLVSDKGDLSFEFDFNKDYFSKNATIQQLFSLLGKDSIDFTVDTSRNFDGSKYNSNMKVSAKNLASFDASTMGVVDGKLKLLPYITVKPTATSADLYDCKDQLCMTQINASFSNNGLLEKVARLTNKDPNTTPQQILGSYGALLQLFAVQQKDEFLRDTLSSLAMFLQNPKNIGVSVKTNKPMNENALLTMLSHDAKSMQKHTPIKGGKVDLKSNKNLELFNNIQKYFKIDFSVNN